MSVSPRKVEILVKEDITPKEDPLISEVKNEVEVKEDIIIKENKLDNADSLNVALNIDLIKAAELKNSIKEPGWGEIDNHKITDDDGFFIVNKNRRGGKKDTRD